MTYRKRTEIIKILEKLKHASISKDDYVSSHKPCFMNDDASVPFQQYNMLYSGDQIPDGLNRNIKVIYELLGHQRKEIYYGPWTLMSVDEALQRYKELCRQGQTQVFDIGYKYGGMGNIDVLSCDLTSHLLFYRLDGGANDYDRLYNYNHVIKEGSEPYDKFYFSTWFYSV